MAKGWKISNEEFFERINQRTNYRANPERTPIDDPWDEDLHFLFGFDEYHNCSYDSQRDKEFVIDNIRDIDLGDYVS